MPTRPGNPDGLRRPLVAWGNERTTCEPNDGRLWQGSSLRLEVMVTSQAVARLGVDGQGLEADGAPASATSAVAPCVHSGERGLGFGQRGLRGDRELATDLAVRRDVRRAGRFDDIGNALGDFSQLLTSEPAVFVQTCPQNGKVRGIESMVVDCRDLMGHDGAPRVETYAQLDGKTDGGCVLN